jgi:two-component system chemotaxis response regulator CheB
MKVENIIVIGASAGGITAISQLVTSFPKDFNAAIFITLHLSKESRPDFIVNRLKRISTLNCVVPTDGTKIKAGTVYMAPANKHMLVDKEQVLIGNGARENHWRPSIDVLFRSAAASYGACVTGIILTGMLDDGTSGMEAIKKVGGITIVQKPTEAEFSDMIKNVMQQIEVDHVLNIEDMAQVLLKTYASKKCEVGKVPRQVRLEANITKRMSSSYSELKQLGEHTPFTCPDCGGLLLKITDENTERYRCYTGHSFSAEKLDEVQHEELENSIWVAIRIMEERRNLLNSMNGYQQEARLERSGILETHIKRLKKMLGTI